MRVRIFKYIEELDAFDVTPEYRALAERIRLVEWNPVVWIGRYVMLDNDFGEHWFDNWEGRELRRERAEQLGLDADGLLVIDPAQFQDGKDGPCHSAQMRSRFWTDVLMSLELSTELIFDEARALNDRVKELLGAGDETLRAEYIPDLEERIAAWSRENRE